MIVQFEKGKQRVVEISDESLEKLIAEVEQGELLEAPRGMKEAILTQSACIENRERIMREHISPKTQFLSYVVKIGIGMAASLSILFFMGMNDGYTTQISPSHKVEESKVQQFANRLNESSSYISDVLNEFSNKMVNGQLEYYGGEHDDK